MRDTSFEITDKTIRILEKWGEETLQDIISYLASSGLGDSRLARELSFEIKDDIATIAMELKGPEHLKYVLYGRGPGKQPPLNRIQEWCQLKGIPKQAAFPIAYNIGKFGKKPFDFLKPTLFRNLPDLRKKIGVELANELTEDLIEALKTINKQ